MDSTTLFALGFATTLLFSRKQKSSVQRVVTPIRKDDLVRYGQSVMLDRGNKNHTKHSGIDIFVTRAGASVFSIGSGVVIRRKKQICEPNKPCAGLFLDIRLDTGIVARYLHLGNAYVDAGSRVLVGDIIGTVANTGESGLGSAPPHLHFELRKTDWTGSDYGEAIDPRPILDNLMK